MIFRLDADYRIDAERDGKPMTGYGRTASVSNRRRFVRGRPGGTSRKEGKKYRLPTEAEWEYACRAGTSSRYYCGNDPEKLIGFANASDADRAAGFPGETVDVFDKSGKKTGERIPYPFLSGHDGYARTAPVGRFRPNRFGLYDMHGNSWEWCSD